MTIYKETTGQGPAIVLLHGWGCDHRHMQPLVDLLSDNYTVTNLDLPGRGLSDWDNTIKTIDDFADHLLAELPDNATYIGWSFGGPISLSIAARYPERVKRIIGLCTSPKFIASDDWPAVPQPGFKAAFDNLYATGFNNFFKAMYDGEFVEKDASEASYEKLIQLLHEGPENNIDVLLKGIHIIDAADYRKEFSAITCPVDMILGGVDESIPAATHQMIQALNPKAKIHVIRNGRHLPFWTHPDAFNRLLLEILAA